MGGDAGGMPQGKALKTKKQKHKGDKKKGKKKAQQSPAQARPPPPPAPASGKRGVKGGGLLQQMRQKLQGGQFRWLNEQLYTTGGETALDFMQKNPELFNKYHEGESDSERPLF
jgi:ribosomal RNA-processing protein 8